MLRASDLVDGMPPGSDRDAALDDLQAGQSNDPYWHGLFGGVYLPDLRVSNLRHLIGAEDRALRAGLGGASGSRLDLDLDGRDEILLHNDGQIVSVKPDAGAGIGRWDVRAARVPLGAVMRRRPEAYHEKLRHVEPARDEAVEDPADEAAPRSIHDLVVSKQEGLADRLVYDAYERRSGLVRVFPRDATPASWASGAVDDLVPAVTSAWTVEAVTANDVVTAFAADGVALRRTVTIGGGRSNPTLRIEIELRNERAGTLEAILGVELNVMLLGGGHNPGAWYEIGGERFPHDERRTAKGVQAFLAANEQLGVTITTAVEPASDVWIVPIETVSNSEAGFELVYQGSSVLVGRPVALAPGATARLAVANAVTLASVPDDPAPAEPTIPATSAS
jgi:4-alpha-glucanotransferase